MADAPRSRNQHEVNSLLALARDYALATTDGSSQVMLGGISALLRRIREMFRMDVVFVSEFIGGQRVFRDVDAATSAAGIVVPGAGDPLEESYCQRVVDGRLPMAIPDASLIPEAVALPATEQIPVRGHLSVPILLHGGGTFGTLCCFSRSVRPELGDSDVQVLKAIAQLISAAVDQSGKLKPPLLVHEVLASAPPIAPCIDPRAADRLRG